jgi:hypothetical protein
MFEFQSVRRSFPRNITGNSEAASFPQVKLHHLRRKCKNDNPGGFTNGIPAMKNPYALRIFFPEFFGGKYKPPKKHNSRRIIS